MPGTDTHTARTGRPGARARIRRVLSLETTSGILLLAAAALALAWANSPLRDGYAAVSSTVVGPAAIHLDLSLATWAADGLLAVFFFVVGVELKHEFVAGSLRSPREAAVPVLAAVGGMAVPALVFSGVVLAAGDTVALHGWAIPTATDIAFALGVLAVFGRGLPVALRTFLLTLAVVDDLLAIVVIAVFYTASIQILALLGALAAVAVFGLVIRSRFSRWWLLIPVALVAWVLMHESGVHATIAGVLMGFTVPARPVHGESEPRTHQLEGAVRPWSTAVALPVFAFFSAGVSVADGGGFGELVAQPVLIAIAAGLVLGKLVGVLGMTALITRLTPLRLPDSIGIRDLLPVGFLTGIGFTVSLLITELSFPDAEHTDAAKLAVLLGSGISAVLAALWLRWDARQARLADMNEDGVPDRDLRRIGD
ncbi:Na+/H+ antiporter NhaA [Homoserinibacter sp. YIM 151385]|uniref:Na+/H+ antiporter NhaA n=1 Tax=Homoserinibacter sp. YIM 151385 TaxID=2985506 RepID=UPI0022F0A302|nr:Na+/H+ antiporter NhaA [Homoserinibacter sp. YIM 151385]WBU37217.1 Na+/H+ antiporter NhaA [Homoserinibacter sp. YIM 151385]